MSAWGTPIDFPNPDWDEDWDNTVLAEDGSVTEFNARDGFYVEGPEGFSVYDGRAKAAANPARLGIVRRNGNFVLCSEPNEYNASFLRAAKAQLVEEGEVYAGSYYRP